MLCLLLISAVLSLIAYLYAKNTYWSRRGVPHPKPLPYFGNILDSLTGKRSLGNIYEDIYKKYSSYPYIGTYKLTQPAILIRDLDLLRDILIKDFASFHDNDFDCDINVDPMLGRNPFVLKGQLWKTYRSRVTPVFTVAKIKYITPLIEEVSNNLVKYISTTLGEDIDVGLTLGRFTANVVTSTAFGVEGDSFTNPNSEIGKMSDKLLQPSFIDNAKLMLAFLFPIFKVRLIPKHVADWFLHLTTESIEYRKTNKIVRNDMLNAMMELRDKLGDKEFSLTDVTAMGLLFYLDGFLTTSSALTFIVYEVIVNPLILERLRGEINDVVEKYNGKITYDGVQEMTYLDQVVSEGFRKYPMATFLLKTCTADYTLPPLEKNGKELRIEKGTTVVIPTQGIQKDPLYYPNPEEFDPERFSESIAADRHKCAFMPFGVGPRSCLGNRFVIMTIKMGLVTLVRNFDMKLSPKTKVPLAVDLTSLIPKPAGGLWATFSKVAKAS